MKIYELLKPEHIVLDLSLYDKFSVLEEAAFILEKSETVKSAAKTLEGMEEREKIMSTGIGDGIGIPHTSGDFVNEPGLVILRLKDSIEFSALDGNPVDIVMAIVVPFQKTSLHLRILAGISRLCKNQDFLSAIRSMEDKEKLISTITEIECSMAYH